MKLYIKKYILHIIMRMAISFFGFQQKRKSLLIFFFIFLSIVGLLLFNSEVTSNGFNHLTSSSSCSIERPPSWQLKIKELAQTREALMAGNYGLSKKNLVVGIMSVWRKENYLQKTLQSLIDQSDEAERRDAVVVVYLADRSVDKITSQLTMIQKNFEKFLTTGFIQVIQSGPQIYPPMDSALVKRTFNDSTQRILWRTKLVIDSTFLYTYAKPLAQFCLVLNDDVVAAPNYLSAIMDFIGTRKERRWIALKFSGVTGIGHLFRTRDIPQLVQFIFMFYEEQPVDWLMDHFIRLKVPELGLIVERQPSLFQHIGLNSTLVNTQQKWTDLSFDVAIRKFRNRNPSAKLQTTMEIYHDFYPEYPYKPTPGYFWGMAKPNDTLDIVLDRPVNVSRIVVISGLLDPRAKFKPPKDTIEDGVLEFRGCCEENYYSKNNGSSVGNEFGILEKFKETIDITKNLTNVEQVRIRIGPGQKSWVIVREIEIFVRS